MAARFRIIALDKLADAGRTGWRLVFWYDVPAARQQFFTQDPTFLSAWIGANPTDLTALRSGEVFEEIVTYSPDVVQNVAAIEAGAAALWIARNAAFQTANPWANYGTTWDGSTWVLASVA